MEMVVDSLVKNNEIPIVDITHMGRVVLPVRPWVKKAATHLVRGISEKGLVLIVNHGITEEKLQRGYKAMKKFCDLPEETRVQKVCANNTCANTNGNTNRMGLEEIESSLERERLKGVDHKHGYVPPGTDRQARERMEEIRHTYNLTHFNDESVPNDEVPGFTDAVTVLANEFRRVAAILLQLLAVGLEMDPNFFLCKHQRMLNSLDTSRKNKMNEDDSINENNNTNGVISNGINVGDEIRHENNRNNESVNETLLRIVYYPPLGDRMIPGMMRLPQRIECGSFTILAQDSEGGLEVFTNSKWHRVGHLPGALLINMGTLMEDWTTGRFKAMKYRVIIPEQKTIRSRGHFNIGLHVHPEDVIVPYPVVSSSTTQSEHCNSCNCENLRRASKWPLTLTILNAYHNMQTRIQRLRLRRLLRLIPRRFQRRNRSSSSATQNHTLANINNVNIVANNTGATVGEAQL